MSYFSTLLKDCLNIIFEKFKARHVVLATSQTQQMYPWSVWHVSLSLRCCLFTDGSKENLEAFRDELAIPFCNVYEMHHYKMIHFKSIIFCILHAQCYRTLCVDKNYDKRLKKKVGVLTNFCWQCAIKCLLTNRTFNEVCGECEYPAVTLTGRQLFSVIRLS